MKFYGTNFFVKQNLLHFITKLDLNTARYYFVGIQNISHESVLLLFRVVNFRWFFFRFGIASRNYLKSWITWSLQKTQQWMDISNLVYKSYYSSIWNGIQSAQCFKWNQKIFLLPTILIEFHWMYCSFILFWARSQWTNYGANMHRSVKWKRSRWK